MVVQEPQELRKLDFAAPVGVYAIEDVAADVVQSQGFRVLEQYLGWGARWKLNYQGRIKIKEMK